jgi:hypothetical protein
MARACKVTGIRFNPISCIYLVVTLQPFVGPWPLFQFLHHLHSRYVSLNGGSARRKSATYIQNKTKREQTHRDIHASSGVRTHDPSIWADENSSCFSPHGHCDRPISCMERKFLCDTRSKPVLRPIQTCLPEVLTPNIKSTWAWICRDIECVMPRHSLCKNKSKQTPWLLVRKRTIPTERPQLVDEVSANFCG